MKVCVIGGSGFIGTRLAKRLIQSNDNDISIVDKVKSEGFPEIYNHGDVTDIGTLRKAVSDGDTIVNLAAEHRDDVRPISLYDEVNVNGAKNICEIADEKNIKKIVFTSTVAVYGFAPLGTGEEGNINPFNDYGRTKFEAEEIFRAWQAKDPQNRTLVVIRPTVVFGETNRGNVYNLLKQISSGKFVMIGTGRNRKSMAYVENIAAFIEYSLSFEPGVHTYNYIDKPDFDMNVLVSRCNEIMGKKGEIRFRLPYFIGVSVGRICDLLAFITRKKLPISLIRVKKFCSDSVYSTSTDKTGFIPPIPLEEAIKTTICYEFLDKHTGLERGKGRLSR